jgi:hypothetical protein
VLAEQFLQGLHALRQPLGWFAGYRDVGLSGVPGPFRTLADLVKLVVARRVRRSVCIGPCGPGDAPVALPTSVGNWPCAGLLARLVSGGWLSRSSSKSSMWR